MTPASVIAAHGLRAIPLSHELRARRRGRVRRFLASRALAWSVTTVVLAAGVGGAVFLGGREGTVVSLRHQLGIARTQLATAMERGDATGSTLEALRTKVAALRRELAGIRTTKAGTVVKERTVTKTVTKWIPNGEGVQVEVTGYEDMIEIRDVQITHSYGYTDLIGIAVNTSGQTLSYAQLGCTFLDADGKVLANQIDNKQSWLPDQTWGFDCSGQVRATGGILRVDELG